MVGVLKAVGTGDLTVGDGRWLDCNIYNRTWPFEGS